eukprot:2324158-Pyramimonas_sp.AAC.1
MADTEAGLRHYGAPRARCCAVPQARACESDGHGTSARATIRRPRSERARDNPTASGASTGNLTDLDHVQAAGAARVHSEQGTEEAAAAAAAAAAA